MNNAAQQLGRMAKGKPKTLTKAERKRRARSLAVARAKRWPCKSNAEAQRPAVAGTLPPLVGSSDSQPQG